MVAIVVFLLVYYFGWARRSFKGPRAMGGEEELTEIEREFEEAARGLEAGLAIRLAPVESTAGRPAVRSARFAVTEDPNGMASEHDERRRTPSAPG